MAEDTNTPDIKPPLAVEVEEAALSPSSPSITSQPQEPPPPPPVALSSPASHDIPPQSDAITSTTTDDDSRKRKSSETPGIPLHLQSPQKRSKPAVDDVPASTTAASAAALSEISTTEPSPSSPWDGFQPGPPLPSTPPKATQTPPSLPPPRQTSMPPPHPPPHSQLYQPPPTLHLYTSPSPSSLSRENLQFSATDLPKDDDGMMRWLAHRVRDSATLTMDGASGQLSPEHITAGDSDPETRAERERVRAENRERKKKWREENSDRNKDNDLRGRVSRRANKLFGPENSEKKRAWMEDEFNRRKVKREFKTQLKKNETPGSSCWNSNDDFCSDNPSQVMAGVFMNQEGAAENLRQWIENGEIDYETWNAACQRLWGDPGMRAYLENLAPDQQQQQQAQQVQKQQQQEVVNTATVVAVSPTDVKGEPVKAADDGLASKFDAAFDAIIGRGAPKAPVPVPATQEVMESNNMAVEDGLLGDVQMEDVVAAAMEMEGVVAGEGAVVEEEEQPTDAGNLTVEDLARLIESGDMSFEDIAALEAALRESGVEEEQLVETEEGDEVTGNEIVVGAEEGGTVSAAEVDMALPDLHSDHTDISDLHQHLEVMSPNTRDAFIATIMGQDGVVAMDEMQLDDTALLLEGGGVAGAEAATIEDVEMQMQQEEDVAITDGGEGDGDGDEETAEAEASILEFLEGAGIKLDELNEEQLQKFINAVSGDGDIEEILAEIQAAQSGGDVASEEQDLAISLPTAEEEQPQHQPQQQEDDEERQEEQREVSMGQEDAMDLTAQISGEEEDGMYGDGDEYDDDEDLDLTPDIMRIILQSSGLALPDSATGGDTHTLQPSTAQLPLLPTTKPATGTSAPRQAFSSVSTTAAAQPRPSIQSAYAYSPARYSYSSYAYGYQKRPEVQVLPPGYTAYSRPPPPSTVAPPKVEQRIPDFGHLIKPLAYKPVPKPAEKENAEGKEVESGEEKKKGVMAGWAEIFKFEIPIPSFLGRGGGRSRENEAEKMEEERNIRAMGFPPMAKELKILVASSSS